MEQPASEAKVVEESPSFAKAKQEEQSIEASTPGKGKY